jgi:Holliday junction resolvasome RuvABC endonuclease subunit
VKVIGIDPSLTATGLARVDGQMEVFGGKADLGDSRLWVIHNAVAMACLADNPDLAVIEDLPKHAQGAGLTGMVQGVVRLALLGQEIPYVLVVGSTLKKYATGDGRADKSDLRMALFQRAGIDERDDNKVDAWWLRHMGLDQFEDAPIKLPAAQRKSLDVVRWPALTERTPAP